MDRWIDRGHRALNDPSLVGRYLNRAYHTRGFRHAYNKQGVDIVAEDWDNLIILDACRYDTFEQRHGLPGRLERRESAGSSTVEFLVGNFGGRRLHDTVYVSANGQVINYATEINAKFHYQRVLGDEWDDDLGTVPPEPTVKHALAATDRFPDKRLIIHFLQPHYPFVGAKNPVGSRPDPNKRSHDFWGEARAGRYNPDRVLEDYTATLDYVLPHVERLLSELQGRTVVTSDHGNLFGERVAPIPVSEWGHPRGIHVPGLVDVPWLVLEGERRQTTADPPVETDQKIDEGDVEERLRQLGYV